ncbi:MAG: tetratricopeptide repeat protein, partial [Chloroflexota bacterium]
PEIAGRRRNRRRRWPVPANGTPGGAGAMSLQKVGETTSAPAAAGPATPDDYSALCQEARLRRNEGDAGGSASAARRALALLPRGLEAQRALGLALLDAGEARPALSAFQAALACDPLDVVSQVGSAEAQERIGGPQSAATDWLRAWELAPGVPGVEERMQAARGSADAPQPSERPSEQPGAGPPLTRAALAGVYLRGGLYEHAVAEARSALGREPERPDLQLVLAEAFWRSGDAASAAAVAEQVLGRQPDSAAANLLLAAHWQTIGRDPAPLVARVQAVDPDGQVSARLFDDRESPVYFEEERDTAGHVPSQVGTDAYMAAPSAAPSSADELAPPLTPAAEAEAPTAEAQPPADIGVVVFSGPVAASATVWHVEPDPEGMPGPPPSPTLAPPALTRAAAPELETERETEAGPAPPEHAAPERDEMPAAELTPPVAAVAEPSAPALPSWAPPSGPGAGEAAPAARRPVGEADADQRVIGDEAMRAGRYLEAMRAYGKVLRDLRASQEEPVRRHP